jgi:signal peptidase I
MGAEPIRGRFRRARVFAVVAALIGALGVLLIDVFEVRGSSMLPALRDGGERSDRIVSVALLHRVVGFERFGMVVFERPEGERFEVQGDDLSDDLCVKRVVALAGERPVIIAGDIFIETEAGGERKLARAHRTPGQIREMMVVVDTMSEGVEAAARWRMTGNWERADGRWSGIATDSAPATAPRIEFDALVTDSTENANGSTESGGDVVHDTGVRVRIRASSPEVRLCVELRERGDTFRVTLSKNEPIRVERSCATSSPTRIGEGGVNSTLPDGEVELIVSNVDDRVVVHFNEEVALDLPYPPNEEVFGVARNDPTLSVEQGRVGIDVVQIVRDVHYLDLTPLGPAHAPPGAVPEDGLFVLGDNPRKSIDSRDYGPIRVRGVRGVPVLRLRPGERTRWL